MTDELRCVYYPLIGKGEREMEGEVYGGLWVDNEIFLALPFVLSVVLFADVK